MSAAWEMVKAGVVRAIRNPVTGGIGIQVAGVDAGTVANLGVYNYDYTGLRKVSTAVAKVRAGLSNARLLVIGDSTDRGSIGGTWPSGSYATCWPSRLASMLNSYFAPTAYDNLWCDGALGNSNFDLNETRVSRGAWFVDVAVYSGGGNVFKTSSGGTSGFVFTPLGTWDTVDIYVPIFKYNGTSYANNGLLTFKIDGSAPSSGVATFNTNTGVDGLQKITIGAASVGTHALTILQDSRAGYQTDLIGLDCYTSTTKKILVEQMGWSGSKTPDWVANSALTYSPLSMIAAVAPDLTIINLTINDLISGTSVATWAANMQTIITTAKASGDVIIRIGNPTTSPETNHPGLAETYVTAAIALASANSCLLMDTRARWVSASNASTIGYLGADGVHPTAVGYCDISQFVYSVLDRRL